MLFLTPLQFIIASDLAWEGAPQGLRHALPRSGIDWPFSVARHPSFSAQLPANTMREAVMALWHGPQISLVNSRNQADAKAIYSLHPGH